MVVAATLTLLTPLGLLIALAGVAPLVALILTGRRAGRVREALRIERAGGPPVLSIVAIALLSAFLAVAAAQPAVRTTDSRRIRTDAQAFFVFDISRSMLAASGPDRQSRLDRAERVALRVRSKLEEVPSGIATYTDRVLPTLFPTSDDEVFTATVEQSIAIDEPPPRGFDLVTSTFAAFDTMAGDNFFDPGTSKRLVVVLTDGETAPYDREALRRVFEPDTSASSGSDVGSNGLPVLGGGKKQSGSKPVRTRFVVVRFWKADEQVYFQGKPVPAYKLDPSSGRLTQEFADTVRGTVVSESDVDGVARAARDALGSGPIRESGRTLRVTPLAKWFVFAALVPLLGLLWRRNLV